MARLKARLLYFILWVGLKIRGCSTQSLKRISFYYSATYKPADHASSRPAREIEHVVVLDGAVTVHRYSSDPREPPHGTRAFKSIDLFVADFLLRVENADRARQAILSKEIVAAQKSLYDGSVSGEEFSKGAMEFTRLVQEARTALAAENQKAVASYMSGAFYRALSSLAK